MKRIMIIATVLTVLASAGLAQAAEMDDVTRELVARWSQKRDELSLQVVKSWLRQEPAAAQQRIMAEWANTCLNIAITTRDQEPVLRELSRYECKPAGMLEILLREDGVVLRSGDSFAGKRFRILERI